LVSGKVTEGAVLVISDEMAKDIYAFQCTTSNQYNSVSAIFRFMVEGILATDVLYTNANV